MKLRLPRATAILAALDAVGRPRSLATVRGWTSGAIVVPCWAAVAIADATGFDLERLVRELTRRWLAKQG
jgi:hypothetical protein